MSVTKAWDETDPANSKNPKLGAGDIRTDKQATRERMENGGHYMLGSGTDTDDGKHVVGIGAESTGEFTIYADDKTTVVERIGDSTAASPNTSRKTFGDGRGGSDPYTLEVEDIEADTLDLTGTLDVAAKATFAGEVDREDKLTIKPTVLTEANDGFTLDDEEIVIVTPGAAMEVNLPTAVGITGRTYTIICSADTGLGSAFALSVDPDGTETIGGLGAGVAWQLGQGDMLRVISDGTNWQVLQSYRAAQTNLYMDEQTDEIDITEAYAEVNSIASVYVPVGGTSYVLVTWSGTISLNRDAIGSPTAQLHGIVRRDTTTIGTFTDLVKTAELAEKVYRVTLQFLDTGATPTLAPGTAYDYNVMLKQENAGSGLNSVTIKTLSTAKRTITAVVQRQAD